MIATLGHLSLWMAAGGFAWCLSSSVCGRGRGPVQTRMPRFGMTLGAASVCCAVALLVGAFLADQFGLAYVANHSNSAAPLALKVAAIWSGQEGSLLLWALLCSIVAVAAGSRQQDMEQSSSSILPAALGLFLVLLLCTSADPFVPTGGRGPDEGRGLSQSLQHWAMVLHPPTLFAGYAFATIPAAVVLGALATGRLDQHAARRMQLWAFFAWLFLGTGMVLGAWWAYVQLGWGGYWAWDPVENAALMPWLTCTALVHTLGVQARTGRMVRWSAVLAVLTFLLCLLGTYITRSGVVQSVHAFARGDIGPVLLAFLIASSVVCGSLIMLRWRGMEPTAAPAGRREWLVGVGNVCLVLMAAVVMFGTLLSAVSAGLFGHGVGVGPSFYARTVVPLGFVGVTLMVAATPRIGGRGSRRWAASPRTIGMLAAHLGVLCAAIGIAGSAGFQTRRQVTLGRGEAASVGGLAVRLIDMHERRAGDRSIVEAAVEVQDPPGRTIVLRPQRIFVDLSEEVGSRAAIQTRLDRDVYISLVGWDVGAARVALSVDINPLVVWIWIGAGLVLVGCTPAAASMVRESRRRRAPQVPALASAPRPVRAGIPIAAGGLV